MCGTLDSPEIRELQVRPSDSATAEDAVCSCGWRRHGREAVATAAPTQRCQNLGKQVRYVRPVKCVQHVRDAQSAQGGQCVQGTPLVHCVQYAQHPQHVH